MSKITYNGDKLTCTCLLRGEQNVVFSHTFISTSCLQPNPHLTTLFKPNWFFQYISYLFYGIQRLKLGFHCTRYTERMLVTMVYDEQLLASHQ
jgi:Predicted hydrolase of the alpha/beta-hydrolase fold